MRFLLALALLVGGVTDTASSGERTAVRGFRSQIEADWLLQERFPRTELHKDGSLTTRDDAAGGCDGLKDGKWGFHTGRVQRPWWQVDLGSPRSISRVVIWNRCDGATERANRLLLLLSADGAEWRCAYTHDGRTFYGFTDGKPLVILLEGQRARFVRLELPSTEYLHLDEVEVFGPEDSSNNLALHRPADQVSVSPWSHGRGPATEKTIDWARRSREVLAHARRLAAELDRAGVDVSQERAAIARLAGRLAPLPPNAVGKELYFEVRWLQRKLALANPLLGDAPILFTKRVPGSFSHMSDQYIGWWSQPGGGIYILRDVTSEAPRIECITGRFDEAGSFLRPILSYDAKRVLFAWCRYYPHLAAERDKLNKANVPEDAFFHIFEMEIDGTNLRQLTHGKYDDFDARYLPDGRIVFLSTRRGQFIQCGRDSAQRTIEDRALPDVYVRCGGGPERPCVVYTLHTMDADGGNLCAISPFEMFEWTPSVAHDGTVLYSRWDYVDRSNMPYMSLWAIRPDGTNAHLVYGNFSRTPHCTFEPRSIPGSRKIIFTASAHHSQTKGSLVLLDPAVGDEGAAPITRLTPEVPFPEAEGWPKTYYANPWPLSERYYLVAWGPEGVLRPGEAGWARWHTVLRPPNGMGIYLFDAEGNMELLHRDPEISSLYPIPLRPRSKPLFRVDTVDWGGSQEGRFLLVDVYRGLKTVKRGDVKALRIVAVPPKTHPTMNYPSIGVTRDDPGKCVLGSVPIEEDGSAHFRVPAGVTVFFQALDSRGMAIQTMRSATHVQPGQTLGCVGCHEARNQAPPQKSVLAAMRPPSRIRVGPEGSWPLRFDRLVQPVLERHCTRCHSPDGEDEAARVYDLSPGRAYDSLVNYGQPSLKDHVLNRYGEGRSREGACAASQSQLLNELTAPDGHHGVKLTREDLERLIVWMDTYAQKAGSFSDDQERRLLELRRRHAALLAAKDR